MTFNTKDLVVGYKFPATGTPNEGEITFVKNLPYQGTNQMCAVHCSKCSVEGEVFPVGHIFPASHTHLRRGRLPCPCSPKYRFKGSEVFNFMKQCLRKWGVDFLSITPLEGKPYRLWKICYRNDQGDIDTRSFYYLEQKYTKNPWRSLFSEDYKGVTFVDTLEVRTDGENLTLEIKGLLAETVQVKGDLDNYTTSTVSYTQPQDMTEEEYTHLKCQLKWYASLVKVGWFTPMIISSDAWDLGVALELLPCNHPVREWTERAVDSAMIYLK